VALGLLDWVGMAQILLLEDDANTAKLVALLLRKRSHQVEIAANGEVALHMLVRGMKPDVVLTDLQMPVMDGISFLDNLRAFDRFRSLPVVVISGIAGYAADELAPYGVKAILTKGRVDWTALAESIDRLDQIRQRFSPIDERPQVAVSA
jgi:two-component system chemotaxis response regulator CheY